MTEKSQRSDTRRVRPAPPKRRFRRVVIVLNILIAVLVLATGYFSYAFISNNYFASSSSAPDTVRVKPVRVLQLDVINGCGVKNVGAKFTDYLRTHGFDVVEVKNYKSSRVPQTLVVDRVGNLDAAREVALALGVESQNVIQQLSPDYYVDVSVIIGEDYATLPHAH